MRMEATEEGLRQRWSGRKAPGGRVSKQRLQQLPVHGGTAAFSGPAVVAFGVRWPQRSLSQSFRARVALPHELGH